MKKRPFQTLDAFETPNNMKRPFCCTILLILLVVLDYGVTHFPKL